jgi:Protein of unknown function (DUF4232)
MPSQTSSTKTAWILVTIAFLMSSRSGIAAQAAPTCEPDQLTLRVDDGQGRFDGMSQSGMVLTVTHRGHASCSLPLRPELGFEDSQHQPLPVSQRMAPGMHPGPVLVPIVLAAHALATSDVRWVSGDVYDNGLCITPAFVSLQVGEHVLRAPFRGRLCGPHETGPYYRATLFKLVR